MNKVRIIGLVLLAIGVVIHFNIENDAYSFFTGLFVGSGIGLLITGRIGKPVSK